MSNFNNTPLPEINDLARNLWNNHVSECGKDHDLAELYAEDRNNVLDAKMLFQTSQIAKLVKDVDLMDTSIREAIVIAFAKDLGVDWVQDTFGYDLNGFV